MTMPLPRYEASLHEQQLSMALLAHAARCDSDAVMGALDNIAEIPGDLSPLNIIGALLTEFKKGIDASDVEPDELAAWFSSEARDLAIAAATA